MGGQDSIGASSHYSPSGLNFGVASGNWHCTLYPERSGRASISNTQRSSPHGQRAGGSDESFDLARGIRLTGLLALFGFVVNVARADLPGVDWTNGAITSCGTSSNPTSFPPVCLRMSRGPRPFHRFIVNRALASIFHSNVISWPRTGAIDEAPGRGSAGNGKCAGGDCERE
jgi:hypothetical protein